MSSVAIIVHPHFTHTLDETPIAVPPPEKMTLKQVYPGLLVHILEHLDAPTLLSFGSTCRYFNAMHKSDALWRSLLQAQFGVRADHLDVADRAPISPAHSPIDVLAARYDDDDDEKETPRRVSCVPAEVLTNDRNAVRVDAHGVASSYDVFKLMTMAFRSVVV